MLYRIGVTIKLVFAFSSNPDGPNCTHLLLTAIVFHATSNYCKNYLNSRRLDETQLHTRCRAVPRITRERRRDGTFEKKNLVIFGAMCLPARPFPLDDR